MTSQDPVDKPPFSADTMIADAVAGGPHAVAVFIRYRMYCIGCAFARFENLQAAAINHQVDVEQFVASLNEAVHKAAESKGGSYTGDPTQSTAEEG